MEDFFISCFQDNHEKVERLLEITSKSESVEDYTKNENWGCVIEDGSALSNDSATSEYLNQEFCVVDESPSNMNLKHLVLLEQTKKVSDDLQGYLVTYFCFVKTARLSYIGLLENSSHSILVLQRPMAQNYSNLCFLVKMNFSTSARIRQRREISFLI